MNTTLTILVLIAVLGYIIYCYFKTTDQNNETDIFEVTKEQFFKADETKMKEQITNTDFVKEIWYIENQNRIRHDDKMVMLGKIKFWLTIIGIYVLFKIIIAILIFVAEGTVILSILNEIQKLFKYTI